MLPLFFPDGEGLDQDTGLKQHLGGDIGQSELGVYEITPRSPQKMKVIILVATSRIRTGSPMLRMNTPPYGFTTNSTSQSSA